MNEQYTPIEEKTQQDYDRIAGAFSASRKEMRWPEVDQFLEKIQEGADVLDLGCGSGRICLQLREANITYTGVDISEQILEQARQSCSRGNFVRASMRRLPFDGASFDVVLLVASLHHLMTKQERAQALTESMRVLRPGGRMFVTVMNFWRWKYVPLFFQKDEGKATLAEDVQPRLKWNDVFKSWKWGGQEEVHRYYHAFTKGEVRRLFSMLPCSVERLEYVKQGENVFPFFADNLVVEARKRL